MSGFAAEETLWVTSGRQRGRSLMLGGTSALTGAVGFVRKIRTVCILEWVCSMDNLARGMLKCWAMPCYSRTCREEVSDPLSYLHNMLITPDSTQPQSKTLEYPRYEPGWVSSVLFSATRRGKIHMFTPNRACPTKFKTLESLTEIQQLPVRTYSRRTVIPKVNIASLHECV